MAIVVMLAIRRIRYVGKILFVVIKRDATMMMADFDPGSHCMRVSLAAADVHRRSEALQRYCCKQEPNKKTDESTPHGSEYNISHGRPLTDTVVAVKMLKTLSKPDI